MKCLMIKYLEMVNLCAGKIIIRTKSWKNNN